jgi:ADP-ribosyl-[dinitrogen reductase] hydrolase
MGLGPSRSCAGSTRYPETVADYRPQLETAVNAALGAGEMLREEFHRPGGPRGEGGHADIDEIAEVEIHRTLSGRWPQYGYRGEELGFKGAPKDPEGHCWVVDPNDGTNDFLRGFRGSSVAIALLCAGRPVLGVVYAYCAPDSAGDLISWAEGCEPVFHNGAAVVRTWPDRPTGDSTVLVSTYADFKMELNARAVAPMRFRGMPSIAYRMALMAVGEADATVSLNGPHSWDYAAGHALLMGAGGRLADARGRTVTYSNDGDSDCGGACYAGPEALIWDLLDRDWNRVRRGPRERQTPFVLPLRGAPVRDPGLLSRAQGALIGQFARSGTAEDLPGQPSGGSAMALALARSIVQCGQYDAEQAARAYTGIGPAAPDHGGDALLRGTPIGIAFEPAEAWNIASTDSGLTQSSGPAREQSALFAAVISYAVRSGNNAESVYRWTLRESAARGVTPQALFRRVLEHLRAANGPAGVDDPIAGALYGAVNGLRRLPPRWIDRVLTARPIAGLPGVRHPRPPECWPVDALYLAERLLTIAGPSITSG